MALRNFTKMLFRSRVATKNGGGIQTKYISDEKLRSLAVRLEQATKEANQLADECKAFFALKRAFPMDRIPYIVMNTCCAFHIAAQAVKIRRIKVKDSQLAASLAERQESKSPA